MANILYVKGKEGLVSGAFDLASDTIKAILLDSTCPGYNASHEFLSSVSAYRVGTDQTLTGKSVTGGVFDAGDATFPSVSGLEVGSLAIYKDTGDPATSPLLAWIDDAAGLPVTPSGADIVIAWDDGASKILAL